jgi:hypothetical protein
LPFNTIAANITSASVAVVPPSRPTGWEFLHVGEVTHTPARLQTSLSKERQLEIARLVESRQGKLAAGANIDLFLLTVAQEQGITIQDIRASQHTAQQERLALPGASSTQAQPIGSLEHRAESSQGDFFNDFQMDDAPSLSAASSPREETFNAPGRVLTDPSHTTSAPVIPAPPRIDVAGLPTQHEAPRQIPQRKPSIEILREQNGSIRLKDPESGKEVSFKKQALKTLQYLRNNREQQHTYSSLSTNLPAGYNVVLDDFQHKDGILKALIALGRNDELHSEELPSQRGGGSKVKHYQWRPYEEGSSHPERIQQQVAAPHPPKIPRQPKQGDYSYSWDLYANRNESLERLAGPNVPDDRLLTSTEVAQALNDNEAKKVPFREFTASHLDNFQRTFMQNLRFKRAKRTQ